MKNIKHLRAIQKDKDVGVEIRILSTDLTPQWLGIRPGNLIIIKKYSREKGEIYKQKKLRVLKLYKHYALCQGTWKEGITYAELAQYKINGLMEIRDV